MPWPGDFLLRVGDHLFPLRQPAGRPGYREQDGEHLGLEAHGLIDDSRIEIDVGIELALNEIFIFERDLLQLQGDVQLRDSAR